ncbi:MAG: LamG domain-containing protein [Lentisphaerota bacterium]
MNRKIVLFLLCGLFFHGFVFAQGKNKINGIFESDKNTIALWKMNEGIGQIVKDCSVNKNDALLGASDLEDEADPTWQEYRGEFLLCFDGEDDFLLTKNSESFNLTKKEGFTIECILKPMSKIEKPFDRIDLIGKGYDSDPNGGWNLIITKDLSENKIVFSITASDKKRYNVRSSKVNLPFDQWSYIAAVADGKTMSIFLNGEKIGETQCGKLPAPNSRTILIGKYCGDSPYDFKGYIREIRLSDIGRKIEPLADMPLRSGSASDGGK